ncbi:MAG: hypothetical protein H0T43_04415 [Solirubrobacterales bacterium]|nr:hypothetical protein [Solirubrobacterales bacterium]
MAGSDFRHRGTLSGGWCCHGSWLLGRRHGREEVSLPLLLADIGRLSTLPVVMVALWAAGCGGGGEPPPAAAGGTQTHSAQQPSRKTPTRLTGGPLVFRVRGATRPTPAFGDPQLRYVLIFRLNRPPKFSRGVLRPSGAATRLGNVQIANLEFDDEDYAIFDFDPVDLRTGQVQPDRDNCFIGEIRNDRPATVRALDAIRHDDRTPPSGRRAMRLVSPLIAGSSDLPLT